MKVYLTASAHVRALRRWKELTEKGQTADLAKIEEDINERDYQDMHREHSRWYRQKTPYSLTALK